MDSITRLLDSISFSFSFEAPSQLEQAVFSNGETISIQAQIQAGQITLNPWPLMVPAVQGFIIGYETPGYPDHPQPILVEFNIKPQG
ncbi:MAG: hypothetical protein KC496_05455 [Anaerolineae bacterium]|nr:hypothetical protein [Anaerolineae bacterium]